METSAESLRERRRRETADALTATARRLTTEQGFTGFTVDELCAEVGVSRRTFFNYFASKEHAVFGFTANDPRSEALDAEFLTRDGDLLTDFVELSVRRFEVFNPINDARPMFALIDQEPRLLKSLFHQLGENERRDRELVARRMTGDDVDLRAEVLVHSVGALVRMCMDQLLHHDSPEDIRDLMAQRLRLARSLFVPTQKVD